MCLSSAIKLPRTYYKEILPRNIFLVDISVLLSGNDDAEKIS